MIIENAQRCSIYTHVFFGYVMAWKVERVNDSIKSIAEKFIKENDLYDVTDWKTLTVNYTNFTKRERDLVRQNNNN
jgi:radical SAM superfamily enzyme YgiQ (UPF0313 family)